MSRFKQEWKLKQITPLLHFQVQNQAAEPGAIIRGSELKPKLDKFLIAAMSGNLMECPENWLPGGIQTPKGLWEAVYRLLAEGKISPEWVQNLDQGPINEKEFHEKILPIIRDNKGWELTKEDISVGTPDPALCYKVKIWAENPENRVVSVSDKEIENQVKKELRLSAQTKRGQLDNEKKALWDRKELELKCQYKNEHRYLYEMYFGNMGKSPKSIRSVFYPEGISLRIICFYPQIIDVINANMELFFFSHNFGLRKSKGFGSFVIDEKPDKSVLQDPKDLLKTKYPAFLFFEPVTFERGNVYYSRRRGNREERDSKKEELVWAELQLFNALSPAARAMDQSRYIYALMKSGINFSGDYYKAYLPLYFLNQNPSISSDKVFIKRDLLKLKSDQVPTREHPFQRRYIRALLGLTEGFEMESQSDRPSGQSGSFPRIDLKEEIKIEHIPTTQGKKERFTSPIQIKVTGDLVFFLMDYSYQTILDETFNFSSKNSDTSISKGPLSIKTPEKFDHIDFLRKFCRAINEKNNPWSGKSLKQANRRDHLFLKSLKLNMYQTPPHYPHRR